MAFLPSRSFLHHGAPIATSGTERKAPYSHCNSWAWSGGVRRRKKKTAVFHPKRLFGVGSTHLARPRARFGETRDGEMCEIDCPARHTLSFRLPSRQWRPASGSPEGMQACKLPSRAKIPRLEDTASLPTTPIWNHVPAFPVQMWPHEPPSRGSSRVRRFRALLETMNG